ncbi:radical SAM protein [Alicyclobacillus contaminans]|nr:radical SAM protein [Alicyclobacillus contaminans]
MRAKQVMNRVTAPSMPFEWSLNPYRGCTHGCSFCYARSTHSYMGLTADDTFQTHIFVKANAPEALEAQLKRMAKRFHNDLQALAVHIGRVAIGTATDPYQPVEARCELTRRCLMVLARYQVPVTVTTRSPLILRDIPLLQQMNVVSIQLSVHTLNKDIWRKLEPASPAPMKRLEAVRELVRHGLPAGVFVAPIVPYLTDSDEDLEAVIGAAKAHGATFVVPSLLRLADDVKPWFLQTVARHYPDVAPRLEQLYKQAYPPRSYAERVMQRARGLMLKHGVPTLRYGERPLPPRIQPDQAILPPMNSDDRPSEQLRLPI